MKILKNLNLKDFNTFGIDAHAKFFVELQDEADFRELFNAPEFKENKKIFLGGGSNVLFTGDFDGMVILNRMKGVEIVVEDENSVSVKSMGGESWHDFVNFCVEKGLWGVENLALIPGTVGAAPIQNIGAYGSELKDVMHSLEYFDLDTGEKKVLLAEGCNFGYRDSIFKNELKDRAFITSVTFLLQKEASANASYRSLDTYLKENNKTINSPKDVSDAVSAIRMSKLPNPKEIGNAGSFFKNVFVSKEKLEEIQKEYGEVPFFTEGDKLKIPSGWLIEKCGFKGQRYGDAGVYENQALILVNYGNASGKEIKDLAFKIIEEVEKKFGIKLTPEVNLF